MGPNNSLSNENLEDKALSELTTKQHIREVLRQRARDDPGSTHTVTKISQANWTDRFWYEHGTDDLGEWKRQSKLPEERQGLIQTQCEAFYEVLSGSEPDGHQQRLEALLSVLVECKLWIPRDMFEQVVEETWSIFSRMPAIPPALPDALDSVPREYFEPSQEKGWSSLGVVNVLQKSLIIFVVCAQLGGEFSYEFHGGGILAGSVDLIEYTVRQGENLTISTKERSSWFLVRAYLWAFWQRLRTLRLYFVFADFAKQKIHLQNHVLLERNFDVAPGWSVARLTRSAAQHERKGNICTWILDLIRSEVYCFGLDFDILYRRYSSVLGRQKARCLKDSDLPCDGKHSKNCLRFHGLTVPDQSAHDSACCFTGLNGNPDLEPKLKWNRESFISIEGPKVVDISCPETTQELCYCSATSRTMAVSHVWSHGQGGRPEEGINQCLHKRYCQIAAQLGCDSYWWDAACIPSDHNLRQEAILQINEIFSTSRVVLVCDQDLMQIDAHDLTLAVQETICAVTMLSDWNTRAWTLLEGIKGRKNIHILCKDRVVVDFCQLFYNIATAGRIDVTVFTWHMFHLLPGTSAGYPNQISQSTEADIGGQLSYRPASRTGDDFVIWALLQGMDTREDPPSKDFWNEKSAKTFWKAQVGRVLPTGYLMSSTPRL